MATRSAIGYRKPDGSVRAVYCHWDGYPKHQLPILEKHYSGTRKVQALIKPGSMSSLRTRQVWEHSNILLVNDEPVRDDEGYLRYVTDRDPQPLYHRERGAMGSNYGEPAVTSDNPTHLWFYEHDCEYLYVWEPYGKTWTVYSQNDPFDS